MNKFGNLNKELSPSPIRGTLIGFSGESHNNFGKTDYLWEIEIQNKSWTLTASERLHPFVQKIWDTGFRIVDLVKEKDPKTGFTMILIKPVKNMDSAGFAGSPPPVRMPLPQVHNVLPKVQTEEEKWNEINTGKCRTLFLVEMFRKDLDLTPELVNESNAWAYACMYGKLKPKLPKGLGNASGTYQKTAGQMSEVEIRSMMETDTPESYAEHYHDLKRD